MATENLNFFILAGMPKSGTTMFSNLIDRLSNVACLDNDIGPTSGTSIRRYLEHAGDCIFRKEPVHYGDFGERLIEFGDDLSFLGTKSAYGYLQNIQEIGELGFEMFAVIRDPVYTIAEWIKSDLTMEHLIDSHALGSSNRNAEVWNYLAGIIKSNFPADRIYRYEDLITQAKYRLMHFCSQLGTEYDIDEGKLPGLRNRNDDRLYGDIDLDAIHCDVREYAPMALEMGYRG